MSDTTQHLPIDLLSAYLDGRVAPSERRDVQNHLDACAECRQELAELRATVNLLNGLPVYRPRRSFQLSAAQFGNASAPSAIVQFLPLVRSLSIAAIIAFIVVAGAQVLDVADNNTGAPNSSADVARNADDQPGETGEAADASQNTEDAPTNGTLIDRGNAASAQDEALADLPASAPDQAAENSEIAQATETANDTGWSPLAIGTLVTGTLALFLVLTWSMIRLRRPS